MDLVLWRHAEAEAGEPDEGRRLTAKGEQQARRAAEWLHARLPDSARILASPAVRVQQTATAFAELSRRKFKTDPRLAPGATADAVLRAAEWPQASRTVVIVGHQPTLGWVASRLLTGDDLPWAIKKAGIWWFQSRVRNGATQVTLRAVVNPDLS